MNRGKVGNKSKSPKKKSSIDKSTYREKSKKSSSPSKNSQKVDKKDEK